MRMKMPQVAAFIDAMREAFGREVIDQAQRDPYFGATENGYAIGSHAMKRETP